MYYITFISSTPLLQFHENTFLYTSIPLLLFGTFILAPTFCQYTLRLIPLLIPIRTAFNKVWTRIFTSTTLFLLLFLAQSECSMIQQRFIDVLTKFKNINGLFANDDTFYSKTYLTYIPTRVFTILVFFCTPILSFQGIFSTIFLL